VFHIVQPYIDGPGRFHHATIVSSHQTAVEASAELDRLLAILRRHGIRTDFVELVVVDAERTPIRASWPHTDRPVPPRRTRHRQAAHDEQTAQPSEPAWGAEAPKATYAEPTIVWRLRRGDRSTARATVLPHGFGCSLIWWVNEQCEGAVECTDWTDALTKAGDVRDALRRIGFVDADDGGQGPGLM
jgi:hypothetical protein